LIDIDIDIDIDVIAVHYAVPYTVLYDSDVHYRASALLSAVLANVYP